MRIVRNTDKSYPCVNCGADDANIVREGSDPRLKCNRCNFMYDASQSKEAQEADAIPDGPPQIKEEPAYIDSSAELIESVPARIAPARAERVVTKVPRTPAYVLISKDRQRAEFTSSKDIDTAILRWKYEDVKFDLFELQPKKVTAKVDIQ